MMRDKEMPELNTNYGIDLLGKVTKGYALRNLMQEGQMNDEQMKSFRQKRELDLKLGNQAIDTGAFNFENLRKLGPTVLSKAWVDQFYDFGQRVEKQNYSQFYDTMMKTANDFGIPPPFQLPAPIEINAMSDEDFGKLKSKTLTSLKDQLEVYKAQTGRITAEKAPASDITPYMTKDGKTVLINERDPNSQMLINQQGLVPGSAWKSEGANQTREQLTARSLKEDKDATAILDAMDKREKDIATVRGNSSELRANRQFAVTLRKEFNALPEVKEYNQTVPKIRSMRSAYELSQKTKNFVAVDQALITLFNKLTDPQSVVRESEYARTAENIPLMNQIKGKVEKVMKGGAGLTAEERKSLMDMANLMQKGYDDIRQQRMNEYRGYGMAGGLDPNFLVDANSNTPMDVMKKLRKANPGVSDADLRAYAKKKGYL